MTIQRCAFIPETAVWVPGMQPCTLGEQERRCHCAPGSQLRSLQCGSLFIPIIHVRKLILWCHYLLCIAMSLTVEFGWTSAGPEVIYCAGWCFLELEVSAPHCQVGEHRSNNRSGVINSLMVLGLCPSLVIVWVSSKKSLWHGVEPLLFSLLCRSKSLSS